MRKQIAGFVPTSRRGSAGKGLLGFPMKLIGIGLAERDSRSLSHPAPFDFQTDQD